MSTAVMDVSRKGEESVAFETKALLTALYSLARSSKSVDEVCNHIKKIANVEGVILTDEESSE